MSLSIFDIFKIGIGPSSSHTVGPMKAARRFMLDVEEQIGIGVVGEVSVQLYGSLALTGKGHCTDRALLLGLEGERPETIDPDQIDEILSRIRDGGRIRLLGKREVAFDEALNLLFHKDQVLPGHSNGMRFTAMSDKAEVLVQEDFYSIGGGFVVRADQASSGEAGGDLPPAPYEFDSAAELLEKADKAGLSIGGLMLENEKTWRAAPAVKSGLLNIWQTMQGSVERGFKNEGRLPGRLNLARRAPKLFKDITSLTGTSGPIDMLDWVNAFALAVNEENAAGGRVVTAPTNGAAGIIPAVLHYYRRFVHGATDEGVIDFLLTAGAIGILYKKNASISGAEMGCQGEVGVACSMAGGGLVAVLGGSNNQIENAAEIGMEHNLGLTCDPIAGLVQIPCIERNAMGAVKAINAARMAMRGDGTHVVHLDQVIATMRQTGRDMSTIYKETSQGGLAVNVPEC